MVATTDADSKLVMLQLTGLPVRASMLMTKVAMNCNQHMSAWRAPSLAHGERLPDIHSAEMCKQVLHSLKTDWSNATNHSLVVHCSHTVPRQLHMQLCQACCCSVSTHVHLQGIYTTPDLARNVLMIGNGLSSYGGHYHVTDGWQAIYS